MPDQDLSDDDWDSLPPEALNELENNAIQYTQARAQTQAQYAKPATTVKAPAPSSDYGEEIGEEDLDDAVIIDESRSTPAIIPGFQRPPQIAPQENFRQQRYGTISNPQPQPAIPNRQNLPVPRPAPPRLNQPNRLPQRTQIVQHDSMTVEQGSQPSITGDNATEDLQRKFQEVFCHHSNPTRLTM